MYNRKLGAALAALFTFLGLLAGGSPAHAASASTPPHDPVVSQPVGVHGVKGLPPKKLPGKKAEVVTNALASVNYYYNVGSMGFTGTLPTGTYGTFSAMATGNPDFDSVNDYHTLMEITAEKTVGGLRQVVEAGVTVDPLVNPDLQPRLFFFHWINGVPQCYNGCGWTDISTCSFNAGDVLTTAKKIGLEHFTSPTVSVPGWYAWVGPTSGTTGGCWAGYFPDTQWSGASPSVSFPNEDYGQLFGEVASSRSPSSQVCSGMGSNTLATSTTGAFFGSATFQGITAANTNLYVREAPTGIQGEWNAEPVGTVGNIRTFRFGGPGHVGSPC